MTHRPFHVTLTSEQLRTAEAEAERRVLVSTGADGTELDPTPHVLGQRQRHLLGAYSELAVSSALRLPWTGHGLAWSDVLSQARTIRDVDPCEVRATEHDPAHLTVYSKDADTAALVLCRCELPTVLLLGWILGSSAKQERYWNDRLRVPAYWVPEQELRPILTLMRAITHMRVA